MRTTKKSLGAYLYPEATTARALNAHTDTVLSINLNQATFVVYTLNLKRKPWMRTHTTKMSGCLRFN